MIKGYDAFYEEPGTYDEKLCKVCGEKCLVMRDQFGPVGWATAVGLIKVPHDYFYCSNSKQLWHQKALEIILEMEKTSSDRLVQLMKLDIDDLISKKQNSKVDVSGLKISNDNSLQNIPGRTLSGYEEEFHVGQIATYGLETCGPNEEVEHVFDHFPEFDQIPVKKDSHTIGVLEKNQKTQHGLVKDHMRGLDDSILVSSNEPLSSFLPLIAKPPYYCLVLQGSKVNGIVTRSDILKLPVRLYSFALVTHLEMLMKEVIVRQFSSEQEWLAHLTPGRRKKIDEKKILFEKTRMDPQLVELTDFCDKYTIINEKFKIGTPFRKDLSKIESKIRNPVAHAATFILDDEGLAGFIELLERTKYWIKYLIDKFINLELLI